MSSPVNVGPGAPTGEGSAVLREVETPTPSGAIPPKTDTGPGVPIGEGAKAPSPGGS